MSSNGQRDKHCERVDGTDWIGARSSSGWALWPAIRGRRSGDDPQDGRPLLARYDFAAPAMRLIARCRCRAGGVVAVGPAASGPDWQHVISLGQGRTPLLPPLRLGAALGCPDLLLKAEGVSPIGSFKARGMAVAVSRAVELGVRSFVVPSAGNAGSALAAYAAAAGADATVLMPADVPAVNRAEVLACRARLVLVDGLVDDCGRLSAMLAQRTGAFDVSTLKEPFRVGEEDAQFRACRRPRAGTARRDRVPHWRRDRAGGHAEGIRRAGSRWPRLGPAGRGW